MSGDCLQWDVPEDDRDLGNWNVTQSWLMKDFYFHLYIKYVFLKLCEDQMRWQM